MTDGFAKVQTVLSDMLQQSMIYEGRSLGRNRGSRRFQEQTLLARAGGQGPVGLKAVGLFMEATVSIDSAVATSPAKTCGCICGVYLPSREGAAIQ
jgi:hypothetical protein